MASSKLTETGAGTEEDAAAADVALEAGVETVEDADNADVELGTDVETEEAAGADVADTAVEEGAGCGVVGSDGVELRAKGGQAEEANAVFAIPEANGTADPDAESNENPCRSA